MLPKAIYEFVPYACLSIGAISIIAVESAPSIFFGVSLYILGAFVWMMRFHNRHPIKRNLAHRGHLLPEKIYEYKPFLFLAISLFLFSSYASAWGIGIGLIIVIYSLYIFYNRYQHRSYTAVI